MATFYETSAKGKIGHFFTVDLAEKKMLTAVIKFEDLQTIKKNYEFLVKNISKSSESWQDIFFFLLY
jgi:hypothetical protein